MQVHKKVGSKLAEYSNPNSSRLIHSIHRKTTPRKAVESRIKEDIYYLEPLVVGQPIQISSTIQAFKSIGREYEAKSFQ